MQRIITLAVLPMFFLLSENAFSQSSFNSNVGIGFQLVQNQKDFGIGINVTSPYFMYDHMAVRVRGNMLWLEHLENAKTTWTPYANFSLGMVGVGGEIGDFMRLYGEGGIVILLPSDAFSSNSTELGGYGLFGFEFFTSPMTNYFIEIGGIGVGARADKVVSEPIYSNGLTVSAGFRFTFK